MSVLHMIIWNNKFIASNIIVLVVLKLALGFPVGLFFALLSGIPPFSSHDIVVATNEFRTELGLSSLLEHDGLNVAAKEKLNDMMEQDYFAHFSPSGVTPWHWIEKSGYEYSYAGENIAIGFFDAKSTIRAWANSASHRENMTNTKYQDIGVAVRNANINGMSGVVIVQLFGALQTKVVNSVPIPAITPKPASLTTSYEPIVVATTPSPMHTASATPLEAIAAELTEDTNIIRVTNPAVDKIAKTLNGVFAIYSSIVAILGLGLIARMREHRIASLRKTFVHVSVAIASIAFPILYTTHVAAILSAVF